LKQLPAIRHLRRKPWSLATLIEGNTISDSPVGIDIDPGFEGVALRNNHFIRVKQEIASYSH
jgi:nitrous oxidase accessory protein NosD